MNISSPEPRFPQVVAFPVRLQRIPIPKWIGISRDETGFLHRCCSGLIQAKQRKVDAAIALDHGNCAVHDREAICWKTISGGLRRKIDSRPPAAAQKRFKNSPVSLRFSAFIASSRSFSANC